MSSTVFHFLRARCDLSMNHGKDGVRHRVRGVRCRYSHQYDNKIHLCKVSRLQLVIVVGLQRKVNWIVFKRKLLCMCITIPSCTLAQPASIYTSATWSNGCISSYLMHAPPTQECFNQGTESVVVPKTYSTGESSWIGIAKYAWSG